MWGTFERCFPFPSAKISAKMQHTFTIDKRTIRVSGTHNGRQYRKATGLVIADPGLWDARAKSLRAKCKDRRVIADLLGIHARLTEKESTARSEADALAAIDYALAGARRYTPIAPPSGAPTFWEYFDEWGSRPSSSQRQRTLAVRVVARLMGRRENWDQIDSAYWLRLMQKMEDAGVPVEYYMYAGTFHGFLERLGVFEESDHSIRLVAERILA